MVKKALGILILILVSAGLGCDSGPGRYLDPNATVEERVRDLLARMTLEEKVGQMTQVAIPYLKDPADLGKLCIGSLLSGGGMGPAKNDPAGWAAMYDGFQDEALKSRLKIPMIYGVDAVHGHNNVAGTVIFPHNIGLGAANDPALVEKTARVTAIEMAATGVDWNFAPCVAVAQDERWGRTYESFSEDASIVSALGAAAVKGYQGAALSDPTSVAACAKHFLADGGTAGGVDRGDARLDDKTLREVFLAPYKAALDAGSATVMASFSSVNGAPMHSSKRYLTDVLKGELGFQGVLVSDWAAVTLLPGNPKAQIKSAINAGIDMVMVPEKYQYFIFTLTELVKDGEVPMERIDDAVRRILTLKFRLGLFERPKSDPALLAEVGSAAHRDVARQAVRESLVLLKNTGVLPVKDGVKKIAVIGSKADDIGIQCGGWTIEWQGAAGEITEGTSILEGIKAVAPAGTQVVFSSDGSGAVGADLVIAVIGEQPYAETQGDDQDLTLDQSDLDLIRAAGARPLVVVLFSGRPLLIDTALAEAEAFVAAWLPGTEGAGVADVLFGKANFTGKLSFTWPASVEQLPINETVKAKSLFPFGFGLSYAQ